MLNEAIWIAVYQKSIAGYKLALNEAWRPL